jgi:hypothetical protein
MGSRSGRRTSIGGFSDLLLTFSEEEKLESAKESALLFPLRAPSARGQSGGGQELMTYLSGAFIPASVWP